MNERAAPADKITVWGVVTGRAHRVHWALRELGLPYETKTIQSRTGETQTAEYTKLNPKQKIPYLQDGDFGLSESAAIVQYLFRKYGDRRNVYAPAAPDAGSPALEPAPPSAPAAAVPAEGLGGRFAAAPSVPN